MKDRNRICSRECSDRIRWLYTKSQFRLDIREIFLYKEGAETLEWVLQKGGRFPIPGNLQGHVEQGSDQTGQGFPTHCRGLD